MANTFDLFLSFIDDDSPFQNQEMEWWDATKNTSSDEVDLAILRERQDAIREIERETQTISEIMDSISALLPGQGENLELAVTHVDTAVESTGEAVIALEKALTWNQKIRGLIVDATAVVAGSGLGAIGFLGGPIVGVPTLIGGVITAASVIVIRRVWTTK